MKNSQKVYSAKFPRSGGFVIPIIIAIVALLVAGGGFIYYGNIQTKKAFDDLKDIRTSSTTQPLVGGDRDAHSCIGSAGYTWCEVKNKCLRTWEEKCEITATTYSNRDIGLEFEYSSKIKLEEENGSLLLSHSIPYGYSDFCDMKDGRWNNEFVDYQNKIKVYDENYISAIKREYGYLSDGYMDESGNLEKGAIFIEKNKINDKTYYKYFTGVEGCGIYIYIISFNNSKTVFIERFLTPPFSFEPPLYKGPFLDETISNFRNIPGIILPEESELIFKQILSSLKVTDQLVDLPVYIQDKSYAETSSCSVTKKVIYKVPKTTAVADASLKILFGDELSKYGSYKSVSIVNGVAKVVIEEIKEGLASCEITHLFSVLNDTLKQYNTIKSVELVRSDGSTIQF